MYDPIYVEVCIRESESLLLEIRIVLRLQMLSRVWRKRSPCALLVGMEMGTATIENSVELPPKIKNELLSFPAIPLLGIYAKEMKTGS